MTTKSAGGSAATIAARGRTPHKAGLYYRVWLHLCRRGLVCRSGDRHALAREVSRIQRNAERVHAPGLKHRDEEQTLTEPIQSASDGCSEPVACALGWSVAGEDEMNLRTWSFAICTVVVCSQRATPAQGRETDTTISTAKPNADGIVVHIVTCAFQDKPTALRVLLPTRLEKDKRYPVLYVLPVEAGDGNHYGNGLLEIKKLGLHDKYGLICVEPTFARLPWYADHPTDARIGQESYLLHVVMPFVEETYPALRKPEGRLLLGFSKSGWGAFTLLLRHPDVFGRAAAWDAPLAMDGPGKYGSGEIFAGKETFEKYRVTRLLEERAGKLGEGKRLAILGYGGFRAEHIAVHALMDRLKIAHVYQDGPQRKHDWHSGWVAEAVEFLASTPVAK